MTNFEELKRQYKQCPIEVLKMLVGSGKIEGSDYVALNPRRCDKKAGSFRIDIASGKFHDFATGDSGSIIDLAVFVYGCDILEAARKLQQLFPSLAGNVEITTQLQAKKKKIDVAYIWRKSDKTQHKYLNRKKISIGNAKVNIYKDRRQLVIPLTDSCPTAEDDLNIKGLQFINENERKFFPLTFKGLFHVASDYGVLKKIIVMCEGYATARSVAESTDFYVIAAMSACNFSVSLKRLLSNFQTRKSLLQQITTRQAENLQKTLNKLPLK